MTNDTNTLNGALAELGETMADNLVTMGVTDATASDGLTTLANKILNVPGGSGGLDLDTAVSLTSNTVSITLGQSVILTSVLTASYDSTIDLEGILIGATINFKNGNVVIGTDATDSNGEASYTYTPASAGTYTLKAVFSGTADYDGCESSTISITVTGVAPASVSLTADKSILSYYDSESAVLSATVLDANSQACEGVTVEFFNGSTSMGTADTNSSGVATKSYSATGAGDLTFKAEVGSLVSETYAIEDCIFWHPTAISYTGTSTSDTVYSLGYDQIADLSNTNFEFSWTFRQTSYGGDVCLGASSEFSVSPIKSNYRVYIGSTGAGRTRHGYRTSSTTNTEGSSTGAVSKNTDHNMKIVRSGSSFTYYFNGTSLGSKTATFFSDYNMFGIHTVQWNTGTTTVSNIKIKAL